MRPLLFRLVVILTPILFYGPVQAGQISFETYGDVGVSYSDGTTYHEAEASFPGPAGNYATANFADPTLISGFSFGMAYGTNSLGAKVGIGVNAIGDNTSAWSPSAPAKENVSGYAHASAQATNRYYYAGGGTNMIQHIYMDFVWDGQLLGAMDGLLSGGAGTEVSYRVSAYVSSEGLWTPEGLGWSWGFDEERTFTLIDDEGTLAWSDGEHTFAELNQSVSGLEEMDVAVTDYKMLQGSNASFLVLYGIEVSINNMEGLDFEEGGFMNVRSDFYDTLGIQDISSNVSLEPVPIPASFLLFGSGLIALLGFNREIRKV